MLSSFATTIKSLLTAITTLAGAANKLALTVDNLAGVAHDKSKVFSEQAQHDLAMERIALLDRIEKAKAAQKAAQP